MLLRHTCCLLSVDGHLDVTLSGKGGEFQFDNPGSEVLPEAELGVAGPISNVNLVGIFSI